ncbi:MAG: HDIG domain-containing protein [Nitrososphaerota archaeon]|nr:HDIG domain-containing protein [Nitrososphaerota archaeon]
MIPDETGATALHAKYGSPDRIIQHCRAVARVSMVLSDALAARGKSIDSKAVLAGALLHDIGRSRTNEVGHGWVGAKILEEEGVDAVVVEIVRRHVGAGISAEEAPSLGFPEGDYVPRTMEQVVVCFADKMISSDRARPFDEEVKRFERKGHDVERLLGLRRRMGEELGEDPERFTLERFSRLD